MLRRLSRLFSVSLVAKTIHQIYIRYRCLYTQASFLYWRDPNSNLLHRHHLFRPFRLQFSQMYGFQNSICTKAVSVVAIGAGVLAGLSLVLLTILDTYRYHEPHAILITASFLSLGISATCTSFVYFDQTRKSSRYRMLRF
jgi:hypothetical protein